MDSWDFSFESITSVVNKVKNAVMNYTEYEIKVRDATNNEPWGASSTLMQEIASGTHFYQHFNEIMSTIYIRLAEPPGPEWRKVYKALQLLEYLIKNGSEKVIDAARSHMYELKALQSFSYTDEKHKDQGINVRTRAKEIIELLGDSEKIKEERKKAKENKNKYSGMASNGQSFTSNSRYGGFGNDSFHQSTAYSSSVDPELEKKFESFKVTSNESKNVQIEPKKEVQKPKVVEANLLDFNDEVKTTDVDEWGDFAAAPSTTSPSLASPTLTVAPTVNASIASVTMVPMPHSMVMPPMQSSSLPVAVAPMKNSMTSKEPAIDTPNQTKANDQFADFDFFSTPSSTQNKTLTNAQDPLAKLVSLDAQSLANSSTKKPQTGPSLNDIGSSQLNAFSKTAWSVDNTK